MTKVISTRIKDRLATKVKRLSKNKDETESEFIEKALEQRISRIQRGEY